MGLPDILLALGVGLIMYCVWRHIVGALGNTHRCTGCEACENRHNCDPKERADKLRKAGIMHTRPRQRLSK